MQLSSSQNSRRRTGVGIDGCRGGWIGVWLYPRRPPAWRTARRFADLHAFGPARSARKLVDMPVGLLDGPGDRDCDRMARRLLGGSRASSIFSPPVRPALSAHTHPEANRRNREIAGKGLSIQAWGLVPRIRELDEWLQAAPPRVRARIFESHPELCYARLHRTPLPPKRKKAGWSARLRVLAHLDPAFASWLGSQCAALDRTRVHPDDLLDAAVLALVAAMPGRLTSLPARPPRDAAGHPMRIVTPG